MNCDKELQDELAPFSEKRTVDSSFAVIAHIEVESFMFTAIVSYIVDSNKSRFAFTVSVFSYILVRRTQTDKMAK